MNIIDRIMDKLDDKIKRSFSKYKPGKEVPDYLFNFFDLISDSDKNENIVWHYTKIGVLEKMFPPRFIRDGKNQKDNEEYGNIKIRFTNSRFLNDSSESLILREFLVRNKNDVVRYLKKNIRVKANGEQIETKIAGANNSYIFCASLLKDSFAFWNKEYSGLNGISIGFKKYEMKALYPIPGNFIFSNINYINPYLKAKLVNRDFVKIFSKYIESFHELYYGVHGKNTPDYDFIEKHGLLNMFLNIHSNYFKHKSWEYERESRIILQNSFYYSKKTKALETLNTMLIPDIEFTKDKISKVHYEFFDKSVIDSIILGPTCGDEQKEAIEKYLEENGYKNIRVEKSTAFDFRYKA